MRERARPFCDGVCCGRVSVHPPRDARVNSVEFSRTFVSVEPKSFAYVRTHITERLGTDTIRCLGCFSLTESMGHSLCPSFVRSRIRSSISFYSLASCLAGFAVLGNWAVCVYVCCPRKYCHANHNIDPSSVPSHWLVTTIQSGTSSAAKRHRRHRLPVGCLTLCVTGHSLSWYKPTFSTKSSDLYVHSSGNASIVETVSTSQPLFPQIEYSKLPRLWSELSRLCYETEAPNVKGYFSCFCWRF